MGLELEVRSDDHYSRSVPRHRITAVLLDKWSVEKTSDDSLLYLADGCRVEMSLGHPETPDGASDAVAWVGFRVPAGAPLESSVRSLRMAIAVAQEVGWRVFDPQRDGYVDPAELEPGPPVREAVARLGREARLRFSFETRPVLSLLLTAGVSVALLALDVVTDVLGELHQEAVRAYKGQLLKE